MDYVSNKKSIAEEAFKKNLIYSKWLWRAAWAIEIVASLIGFVTGWIMAIGTAEFMADNEGAYPGGIAGNVILSGLPFFAIAVVELMKIPMAMGFYFSRRLVWKILFLTALGFLCVMTFETMINGLERGQSQQAQGTQNVVNEKNRLDNLLANQTSRLEALKSETTDDIDQDYDQAVDSAIEYREDNKKSKIKDYDKERDRLEKLKEDANIQKVAVIEGTENLVSQVKQNQNEKDNNQKIAEGEIEKIREVEKAQIQEENKTLASTIISDYQIISSANDRIEKNDENRINEIANSGLFANKSAINTKYDNLNAIENTKINNAETRIRTKQGDTRERIDKIRTNNTTEISSIKKTLSEKQILLEEQIVELNKEINRVAGASTESMEELIKAYDSSLSTLATSHNESLSDIDETYDEKIVLADSRRKSAIEKYDIKQAQIPDLEKSIVEINTDLIETEDKINKQTAGFQMRRIASIVYGVQPSVVTKEQEGLITSIWVFSISLIVAIIGTILALASFVLADREVFTPKNVIKKPISKSLRKLIYSIRKLTLKRRSFYERNDEPRLNNLVKAITSTFLNLKERLLNPKIKYIEKPIEKIVTITKEVPVDKIVFKEVPKEIIKKELVYVPLYSIDGGTVDLTGELDDISNSNETKQNIKKATEQYKTKSKEVSSEAKNDISENLEEHKKKIEENDKE